MDKYIMKLYNEYIDATKLNNESMFFSWINYKEIHLERYCEFLKWFGLSFEQPVVELNRGKYDSLSLVVNEKMIEISPYALDIKKDLVDTYDGKLIINKKNILIETKKSITNINNSFIFLNQIPLCNSIIYDLPLLNKEVYIGFYSSINDLDIQFKKEWLNHIKEELVRRKINFKTEEATTYDTYMNVVKTKLLK